MWSRKRETIFSYIFKGFLVISFIITSIWLYHISEYIEKNWSLHPLYCGNLFYDICYYFSIISLSIFIGLSVYFYTKENNILRNFKEHMSKYYLVYIIIISTFAFTALFTTINDRNYIENVETRKNLLDNLNEKQRENKDLKFSLWDCDEVYWDWNPEYDDFQNKTNGEIKDEIERLSKENENLLDIVSYYESIWCI